MIATIIDLILKQFQKLSSNSLVFALYNGGIGSLLVMTIFFSLSAGAERSVLSSI